MKSVNEIVWCYVNFPDPLLSQCRLCGALWGGPGETGACAPPKDCYDRMNPFFKQVFPPPGFVTFCSKSTFK